MAESRAQEASCAWPAIAYTQGMKTTREKRKGDAARPALTLAGRINLIVAAALVVGVGLVAAIFASSLVNTRERLTQDNLGREADILYASIENLMLPGEAPIAVSFFRDVGSLESDYVIGLYRRDGTGAFGDNATIDTVNRNRGRTVFQPRASASPPAGTPARPYFDDAVAIPPSSVFFRFVDGGRTYSRVYRPLLNLPKCTGCHGGDHTIRGVIDVRSDVTGLLRDQTLTIALSAALFILTVSALAVAIGRFMRLVVVDPVLAIARVCSAVAEGDFSGTVTVARADEIGRLGTTVNGMVRGLFERFELTKYVSAGTISSISSGQEPKRVARTLLFTDVRGFTAYTEKHGAEAVVSVLNRLLEEQARIIGAHRGDIDKFVGDEVVAVFSGDDGPERACAAAAAIQAMAAERAADFDGLAVGAGIASGMVIQGMVGSKLRADFTVIGDPVNVASRLCGMARRGQVLVCDCSFDRIARDRTTVLRPPEAGPAGAAPASIPEAAISAGDRFTFVGPYKAALKGKSEAQKVYLLTGAPAAAEGGADA